MDFKFTLNTTIKDLFDYGIISTRTYNCLAFAGYNTLGVILNKIKTPEDLLRIPKFGKKSCEEVACILEQTVRDGSTIVLDDRQSRFANCGETIMGIITDAYVKVTSGDSEVNSYLERVYPQPCDMHELVMGKLEDMLVVVDGFSLENNIKVRHSYKCFIDLVLREMEHTQNVGNGIYAEYKRKSLNLAIKMENFSYEQISNYFLSPIARDYLEKCYQKQVELSLSVRSRNFVAKFLPHFSSLIKYAEEPLASYRNISPGQSMVKTLSEIFQFNQKFRREFDRVSKLTDDEIQTESLKSDYPFLVSWQCQFVFDFMKENGHAPLFFLMFHYLRLSENKSNKIFCLQHGLFDGKKRTLYEIADILNLTSERCRQITCGKIEVQESSLANNEGWKYYKNLFELPFIYEKADEYIRLKDAEHLPADFEVFASLVKLVANFRTKNVEEHIILMNKKYEDLKLSECFDTLFSIVDAKYSVDTYVAVDSILFTVPESLRPRMKVLVKYMVEEIYKVQITDDERLYLPQNYIDIANELYDILAKKGEPMHVEEIFNEFKKRYPDHKYTDPLQIKPYIFRHKHIKAIGKTSRYALDSWNWVYFGCIRDLLVDLLSASELPLHIDNLYNSVTDHYPNTTKASLAATMENEDSQRFVEFEGGYFGLTSKIYPDKYVVTPSVQRFRFEDRFQMFKDFVDTYHRFPSYNGGDQESSLMRWYYNVTTGILSMTEEQKKMLNDTIKHYDVLGYPCSATENEFLIKCCDVKDYIRYYHKLPSNSNAPELYAWLRRSRDNYDSYTDKRRLYMTDLLNYILSLGFSV